MKKMKLIAWIVSVMALVMLVVGPMAGCGGKKSSASPSTQVNTTTVGQELQDLDAAYKKGIITEKQYEAEKAKLLGGK